MPAWAVVMGVVCTTVPAVPVSVTAWTRPNCRLIVARSCWCGVRRPGPAAARASRAGRGRGCGARGGGRPAAARAWSSGRGSRVRLPAGSCSPSATSSADRSGSEVESRYLPSRRSSAVILARSMSSRPAGSGAGSARGWGGRAARTRRAWCGSLPASVPSRLVRVLASRRAGAIRSSSACRRAMVSSRSVLSRSASAGLWQTIEALGRVASSSADLLDPQVVADDLVAALAGESGLARRGCRRASVRRRSSARRRGSGSAGFVGGEAAVDDGDHPAEPPAPQVVFDLR